MDSALQPTSFELQIKRQPPRTRRRHDFIFSSFFLLRLNYGGRVALAMDAGDLRQSPAGVGKQQ